MNSNLHISEKGNFFYVSHDDSIIVALHEKYIKGNGLGFGYSGVVFRRFTAQYTINIMDKNSWKLD